MTTTDSNGIVRYDTTDPVSPLHTLLNLGMTSVSAAVTGINARTTIYPVLNTSERASLASSYAPTPSRPLFVTRRDAPVGSELEVSSDGTNWVPVGGRTGARIALGGSGQAVSPGAVSALGAVVVQSSPGYGRPTAFEISVPTTGFYDISAKVSASVTPSTRAYLDIVAGTKRYRSGSFGEDSASIAALAVPMTAGQTVKVEVYYASAPANAVYTGEISIMSGSTPSGW